MFLGYPIFQGLLVEHRLTSEHLAVDYLTREGLVHATVDEVVTAIVLLSGQEDTGNRGDSILAHKSSWFSDNLDTRFLPDRFGEELVYKISDSWCNILEVVGLINYLPLLVAGVTDTESTSNIKQVERSHFKSINLVEDGSSTLES